LPLGLVGALVHVHPERDLRLARPDVALEGAERDDVQVVEPRLAVVPLADVPGEDTLAGAVGRRLRERAGAGNRALADVEPVAGRAPARDLGHHASLPVCGSLLDRGRGAKPRGPGRAAARTLAAAQKGSSGSVRPCRRWLSRTSRNSTVLPSGSATGRLRSADPSPASSANPRHAAAHRSRYPARAAGLL